MKNQRRGQEKEPVTLGQFLRYERQRLGLSLRQLSSQVGVHASYLGRIETGDYKQPTAEVLQKIAAVLGVSYADLFAVTGYRIPEELPSFVPYLRSRYNVSEEDARRLARYFRRLRNSHGTDINESDGPNRRAA